MFSSSDEAPEPVAPSSIRDSGKAQPRAKASQREFQWLSPNHEQAARRLLYSPMLLSFKAEAERHDIDYRWLMDTAVVAASLIIEKHRGLWRRLLLYLQEQQKAKALTCLRFTWYPMSDETPTPNKVTYGHSSAERKTDVLDDEAYNTAETIYDAELSTDTAIAKVMATRISWSMALTLRVVSPQSTPPSACSAGLPQSMRPADAAGVKHVIIRGTFPARLRPVQSQTGPQVVAVLSDLTEVPEEELIRCIFRDLHRVDSTDLHPSNLVAMRAIDGNNPDWDNSHLRCSVHRSRTAELNSLKLDGDVDSFFMRTTLHLKGSGVMQAWRTRVRAKTQHVVVLLGSPPSDVQRWRETIVRPIRARVQEGRCSQNLVLKLIAWDTWFTGNTQRSDVVEHYHNAHCPRDDILCARLCRQEGSDLMLRAPPPYSRRSWHGQQGAVDEIILLAATHGFLSLAGSMERKKRLMSVLRQGMLTIRFLHSARFRRTSLSV